MFAENPSPRARRLAFLALSGLATGLAACSAAPAEVVVDPSPPAGTDGTPAIAVAADTAAEVAGDPPPPAQGNRPDVPRTDARQGGADCCKGKNECKGLGGCKTDLHSCRGKNECKGKGGCAIGTCDESAGQAPPPPPMPRTKARRPMSVQGGTQMCCAGKNDCKGLGYCKTDRHDCKGQNDCKGLGGCAGPC